MSLQQQVQETIATYGLLLPGDLVVVGVSGGADSLCLAHVLRALAETYRIRLHIAHLHHGIRGAEADEDARFVAELSARWGLPYTLERVDVPALAQARGIAIEEAARQARYAFLATLARHLGGGSVAVAHNADDQVETVLMHLLRGSGLAGLRGMRALAWVDALRLGEETSPPAPLHAGEVSWQGGVARIRLVRPLLAVPRVLIEDYNRAHGLQPRFDRSNLDQTYYRNRLRHELIPFLETYNPNLCEVVRHTAEAIAGDYDLLRAQLADVWPRVVQHAPAPQEATGEAIVLDRSAFRDLPVGLQRSVLREGIHRLRQSLRNINWVHVDDAVRVAVHGKVGSQATLPQGLVLTLGYTHLTLAAAGYRPPCEDRPRMSGALLPVPVPGEVRLPDGGWVLSTTLVGRQALAADWAQNPDPFTAYLDPRDSRRGCDGHDTGDDSPERANALWRLRTRREGDWFCPLGLGPHRQRLRDFLINARVPQAERASVPLLVYGSETACEEIAWVVGWRVDARFAVQADTQHVLVVKVRRDA